MQNTLPKQVVQQMEEVAEMEKALLGQEPVADPQEPETPTEAAVVASSEAEVAPVEPTPPKADEVLEQKFRTLQGKYDAEVPALHQQLRELTAQLKAAQASLEAAHKAQKVETPAALLTDKDEEAFGTDLVDMVRRAVREATTPLDAQVLALTQENATLKELLGRTGSQVEAMTFEQQLLAVVPDFVEVNGDPRWIAWLDEVDPLSLEPRRVQAEAAYAAGMVAKVANYVSLFKKTLPPAQKATDKSAELQSQVAPSRSSATTVAPTTSSKVYTESEVNRLFDRVAELNRLGKLEEAAKLDAELTSAYNSGRVTRG